MQIIAIDNIAVAIMLAAHIHIIASKRKNCIAPKIPPRTYAIPVITDPINALFIRISFILVHLTPLCEYRFFLVNLIKIPLIIFSPFSIFFAFNSLNNVTLF